MSSFAPYRGYVLFLTLLLGLTVWLMIPRPLAAAILQETSNESSNASILIGMLVVAVVAITVIVLFRSR